MQYNTYYQKHVWKHFEQEQDKSKLVNRLLEEHYKLSPGLDRLKPEDIRTNQVYNLAEVPKEYFNQPKGTHTENKKEPVKQDCCKGATFYQHCKHWVPDNDPDYLVNTLTGEMLE